MQLLCCNRADLGLEWSDCACTFHGGSCQKLLVHVVTRRGSNAKSQGAPRKQLQPEECEFKQKSVIEA